MGVEIKLNTRIESTDELIKTGLSGCFYATGAHKGLKTLG